MNESNEAFLSLSSPYHIGQLHRILWQALEARGTFDERHLAHRHACSENNG